MGVIPEICLDLGFGSMLTGFFSLLLHFFGIFDDIFLYSKWRKIIKFVPKMRKNVVQLAAYFSTHFVLSVTNYTIIDGHCCLLLYLLLSYIS